GVPRDARPRQHREVMAAVRADRERRFELVVAVMRAAPRAGVRMLLVGGGRSVPVLDLDVDRGLGHCWMLDRDSSGPGYRPSACPSRVRMPSLRSDRVKPVNPAPATQGIAASSDSSRASGIPSGSGM